MQRACVSVVASFLLVASVGAVTKPMTVFSFTDIPPADAICFLNSSDMQVRDGALYGTMHPSMNIDGVMTAVMTGLVEAKDPANVYANLCEDLEEVEQPFSWLTNQIGQKTCPIEQSTVITFDGVKPIVDAPMPGPFSITMTVVLAPEDIDADFNDIESVLDATKDVCQYVVAGEIK